MAKPKVCVLRAPGTNCDEETAFAFDSCGGLAERLHVFRLLEQPKQLLDFQVLCIPGGFSYGDDIGAGVIFGSQLRVRLAEIVAEFLAGDRLVLGICNGFQVLLKAGIVPGSRSKPQTDDEDTRNVTLTWNDNGKYTARWVRLRVRSEKNVFLRGLSELELPIAHAEGKLAIHDESIIDEWTHAGQIALSYEPRWNSPETEKPRENWKERLSPPDNPNGSVANIAGLGDETGRVLGLMPHPERFLLATQHPQWTRKGLRGEGTGMQIFRNAVEYFA